MERAPYVEQKAELRIYGGEADLEFDPDDLSALVGIEPSRVWRRGDSMRSGRLREATVWWWETDEHVERDAEAIVLQVLEKFEPVAEQLAQAKMRWGITLAVGLVITMYVRVSSNDGVDEIIAATPSIAFSAETLVRLARLGASFDADLYAEGSHRVISVIDAGLSRCPRVWPCQSADDG